MASPRRNREKGKRRLVEPGPQGPQGAERVSRGLFPPEGGVSASRGPSSGLCLCFLAVEVLRRVCRRGCTRGGLHPLGAILATVPCGWSSKPFPRAKGRVLTFHLNGICLPVDVSSVWLQCPAERCYLGSTPGGRRRADPAGVIVFFPPRTRSAPDCVIAGAKR